MDASYTGNKISEIRKQKGLTQKDLAEMLYVTDKAVSKWERGLNFPDISMLEKVAEALQISVVELLGIEEHSKAEIVSDMTELARKEKEKIVREIRNRGWGSVLSGIVIWICLIYASKIFPDNILFNSPQTAYIGVPVGIIIGNGLVSVFKAKKLLK